MDGSTLSQRARRAHILTYANVFDDRTCGDWLLTCNAAVTAIGNDTAVTVEGATLASVDGIEPADVTTTFWFTPHRDPAVATRLELAFARREHLTLTVTRVPHDTVRIHAYLNDIGGTAIAGWDLTGRVEA